MKFDTGSVKVRRRVAARRSRSTIGVDAKRLHTHPMGERLSVSRCERCCGLTAPPIVGGRSRSIRRKGAHNRHLSCHCQQSEAHEKVQNEAQ